MSMAARWQPERVSLEARQIAAGAAREAGLPLALWLGRLVRDASAAENAPASAAGRAVLGALTQNLRHGDFPPLDEARAYLRLMTEFAMTPTEIAQSIGRDEEHIDRTIRLLGLPAVATRLIEERAITPAHAYVLLEARDPAALAQAIIAERLDVDETRRCARDPWWGE